MIIEELKHRGGARIGWANASWPLAFLNVSSEKIKLNVLLIGKFEFTRDEVFSIKKYQLIPVVGWGIKIEHNIQSIPKKIIFWTLSNPNNLLKSIEATGFLPSGKQLSIEALQSKKGLPVKTLPLVILAIAWNVLILSEQKSIINQLHLRPGVFAFIALFLIFSVSLATRNINFVTKVFLKPDRFIGEITPTLNLMIFISGIMLILFLSFYLQSFG